MWETKYLYDYLQLVPDSMTLSIVVVLFFFRNASIKKYK